jgi:hypothetical protein
MAGHVFISYVHEDREQVDRLESWVVPTGILVWRDTKDLWPGENWRAKIREAISSGALAFVACFSRRSLARGVSYQNEELVLAIEQLRLRRAGEPWLIPVRFDDCDIPDLDIGAGQTLRHLQRVDLLGDGFDDGVSRLIEVVRRILSRHLVVFPPEVTSAQTVPGWLAARSASKLAGPDMPTDAASAPDAATGRVVTFYAYKGRTGRTMAMASIGWMLAAAGLRVLLADLDLRSPALHRFLRDFTGPESLTRPGFIDAVRSYQWTAATASQSERVQKIIPRAACLDPYVMRLNPEFPGDGGLWYLPPGLQQPERGGAPGLDRWDEFYAAMNGGEFIDALAQDMRYHWDYALINGPAGTGDLAEILTAQIPDVLVDCFTWHDESLEGAALVARSISQNYPGNRIHILPVPMFNDSRTEYELIRQQSLRACSLFGGIPGTPQPLRETLQEVEVPYVPYYGYHEQLITEDDADTSSLFRPYRRLASLITDGRVPSPGTS